MSERGKSIGFLTPGIAHLLIGSEVVHGSPDSVSLEEIARAITGGSEPTWLVDSLEIFSSMVRNFIISEKNVPNRSEIKKKLKSIKENSCEILKEIIRIDVQIFIRGAENNFDESVIDFMSLRHNLSNLARICDVAARDFPKGQGKHKSVPLTNGKPTIFIPARTLAARIIGAHWAEHRGVWPGVNNEEFAYACASFWQRAGGEGADGSWKAAIRDATRSNLPKKISTFYQFEIETTIRTRRIMADVI